MQFQNSALQLSQDTCLKSLYVSMGFLRCSILIRDNSLSQNWWNNFVNCWAFKKYIRTTPYHPQCDGTIERFNRTLTDQLAKSVLQQPGEWDDSIKQVAFVYSTSPHSTTGFTPFFLIHGHEARMPANLLLHNNSPSSSTSSSQVDYVAQVTQKLQSTLVSANLNAENAHEKQEKAIRQKCKTHSLCFRRSCVAEWPHYIKTQTCSSLQRSLWSFGVPWVRCWFTWTDKKIHYLMDQSDKFQIVHCNCLRPYNAPVPAKEHRMPAEVYSN